MTKQVRTCIAMMITAVALSSLLLISGCEGSEARKEVTQTVEQAVGAGTAKKSREVKQDVNQIMQQEMERAKKDIDAGGQDGELPGPEASAATPPR